MVKKHEMRKQVDSGLFFCVYGESHFSFLIPQTSGGKSLCSLENLRLIMWISSKSWIIPCRASPCVFEPIVTLPVATASSPVMLKTGKMSCSFIKENLESTVCILEIAKLHSRLMKSFQPQCTSVPAGSLLQALLNFGSMGNLWWKRVWGKVTLLMLTPRLS